MFRQTQCRRDVTNPRARWRLSQSIGLSEPATEDRIPNFADGVVALQLGVKLQALCKDRRFTQHILR